MGDAVAGGVGGAIGGALSGVAQGRLIGPGQHIGPIMGGGIDIAAGVAGTAVVLPIYRGSLQIIRRAQRFPRRNVMGCGI